MAFDSAAFVVFFLIFLVLYALVTGSLRLRNWLIMIASFVFYGYWDFRFVFLLVGTAVIDFGVALLIEGASSERRRRIYLILSLASNLTVLGTFKYFNFFADTLQELAQALGWNVSPVFVSIVLPVGISFYTFQSISYVIDVYRRELPACHNLVEFLAFIAFFPQLVAGPIERASHLLPQFQRTVSISRAQVESAIWLFLRGMFKKVVVADNLDPFVDLAYRHAHPGAALMVLGTLAFGVQIYCDFSGYSDIARGVAQLLGFELMRNFNLPYTALSLQEFWQRWHISLSSWFRDYLYLPLGGNRRGMSRTCLNLTIVMVLAGLWHGARVNFVLWGGWHGAGLLMHRLWRSVKPPHLKIPAPAAWFLTFVWVFVGWMFFRADSVDTLYRCMAALADTRAPFWIGQYARNVLVLVIPLMVIHLLSRSFRPRLFFPVWLRSLGQAAVVLAILTYGQGGGMRPFIYFQF